MHGDAEPCCRWDRVRIRDKVIYRDAYPHLMTYNDTRNVWWSRKTDRTQLIGDDDQPDTSTPANSQPAGQAASGYGAVSVALGKHKLGGSVTFRQSVVGWSVGWSLVTLPCSCWGTCYLKRHTSTMIVEWMYFKRLPKSIIMNWDLSRLFSRQPSYSEGFGRMLSI